MLTGEAAEKAEGEILTPIFESGYDYATACPSGEQETSLENSENCKAFGILENGSRDNLTYHILKCVPNGRQES